MEKKRFLHEDDSLNTNEIIHDYSFFRQLICEEKSLDIDSMTKMALLAEII